MSAEPRQHAAPESSPASESPSSSAGPHRDEKPGNAPERRAMDEPDMGEDEPSEGEPTAHDDLDADTATATSSRS